MQVKSIAECSLGAFCNTFDLHLAIIGLENQFLVFFLSGRLRQVLLYAADDIHRKKKIWAGSDYLSEYLG